MGLITRGLGITELDETPCPEVPEAVYGGGGMGASYITHTEYRERPLPRIRLTDLTDDEGLENKEIRVLDIKDFDSL